MQPDALNGNKLIIKVGLIDVHERSEQMKRWKTWVCFRCKNMWLRCKNNVIKVTENQHRHQRQWEKIRMRHYYIIEYWRTPPIMTRFISAITVNSSFASNNLLRTVRNLLRSFIFCWIKWHDTAHIGFEFRSALFFACPCFDLELIVAVHRVNEEIFHCRTS